MTTLFVMATPIGNLADITLRALETLKGVDIVLCEDTRITKRLMDKYAINKPLLSYHARSKISRTQEIIDLLKAGKNCALVCDAGTPTISDPGMELVRILRQECVLEIERGEIKIEAIPGASALTAALSIAGVNSAEFTFLGFLPHKKGRQTLFREISEAKRTFVFYESPHRIMKTLDALEKYLESGRRVVVCRELTKIYEEVISGEAAFVKKHFEEKPESKQGEFVVIVPR